MDNAQKAIMIGVGLFITIIIISVVLLITNLGTGMVNSAQDKLGNMSGALQNTLVNSYDNKVVTGADVQTLYTQYKNSGDTMFLVINIGGTINSNNIAHNVDKGEDDNFATINDTASTAFGDGYLYSIPSNKNFRTYVIRDGETLVGVYCVQI